MSRHFSMYPSATDEDFQPPRLFIIAISAPTFTNVVTDTAERVASIFL